MLGASKRTHYQTRMFSEEEEEKLVMTAANQLLHGTPHRNGGSSPVPKETTERNLAQRVPTTPPAPNPAANTVVPTTSTSRCPPENLRERERERKHHHTFKHSRDRQRDKDSIEGLGVGERIADSNARLKGGGNAAYPEITHARRAQIGHVNAKHAVPTAMG